MKFPLSWLRAHLDFDADTATLCETLTRIGIEVEGVEDRAAPLASFVIARVIEARQHPNADRLRALRVDIGDGREYAVVCGAPNARTGLIGVAALPGAFIPGTGITLKVGEIRGEKSEAMMLSAREMGLGDDHSGIIDLPEDAPIGRPYAEYAKLDTIIEIKVTPNRGDALSVHGIARDLAAVSPKVPVCILSHIPILSACVFFDNDLESTGSWVIPGAWTHIDARRLKDLFRRHPNVKVCLSGHVHLADDVTYLGVRYLCNGAVSGGWWKGDYQEFAPAYAVVDFFEDGTVENRLIRYRAS